MRANSLISIAAVLATTAGIAACAPERMSPPEPSVLYNHRVVVFKGERKLVLMQGDEVVKVYDVALGGNPKGHKVSAGDQRTPEGNYTLYRLSRSAFHKAIHVSYPNDDDRARAAALGVNPGGQIMIHGLPNKSSARQVNHPRRDWTEGCIAVTNREIDEIWATVDDGTPIEIYP